MPDTSTKTYDWAALVREIEGDRYLEKQVVYEFHGGRKTFKDKGEFGGVYYTAPAPAPAP